MPFSYAVLIVYIFQGTADTPAIHVEHLVKGVGESTLVLLRETDTPVSDQKYLG